MESGPFLWGISHTQGRKLSNFPSSGLEQYIKLRFKLIGRQLYQFFYVSRFYSSRVHLFCIWDPLILINMYQHILLYVKYFRNIIFEPILNIIKRAIFDDSSTLEDASVTNDVCLLQKGRSFAAKQSLKTSAQDNDLHFTIQGPGNVDVIRFYIFV